jgi:hypothetical protein
MRLVGDAELNQARVFALRESRKFRQKLMDPESDEALAFLPDLSLMNKEALIQTLISARMNDFIREANRTVEIVLPVEPHSEASLERQEEYQEEVDNFDTNYDQQIGEELNKIIERNQKMYESWSEEDLKKECIRQSINQLCEFRMLERFRAMCTYFGTYKDPNFKERLFSSFEEFDNLPSEIKEQFFAEYNKLDLSDAELKK